MIADREHAHSSFGFGGSGFKRADSFSPSAPVTGACLVPSAPVTGPHLFAYADEAARNDRSSAMWPQTIRQDHRIIDSPTIHASRSLELPLLDLVDEIPPVLGQEPSTACA